MSHWRPLVSGLSDEAGFGPPATPDDIARIAAQLGQPVPADLAALLLEVGTVTDRYGTDVVWPAARIASDNADLRSFPDYAGLYMPFDPIMFFGDAGNGDLFGVVRRPERDDVFVWDHETDGRWWAARDLTDYLRRTFGNIGDPAWYQR